MKSFLLSLLISGVIFAEDPQQERLTKYLTELISMPTVTADKEENKRALEWVEKQFSELPLHFHHHNYSGHPALVITTKDSKTPDLFLMAHIDVVPAEESQFTPRIVDHKLYGRGAYDMKMAIACYLLLFQELGNELPELNIGIMLTSDEEVGGMNGVKRLLEEGYASKFAFLPDGGFNWNFEESAKGVMQVRLIARGISAHSSRPWLGQNAIELLMHSLGDINHYFDEKKLQYGNYFPTANIGMIQGGKSTNQVPDYAEAKIDIRYPPSLNPQKMFADLTELLEKEPKLSIEILAEGSPHQVDLQHPAFVKFKKIAKELYSIDIGSTLSYGASDARFFGERNIPVMVIAPQGGEIHGDGEWIDLNDLNRFYNVLKAFVLEFNSFLRSKEA